MSTTQGSTATGRGSRADKSRRSWTNHEEEVLVASMKELIAQGWKSDNGFKPGFHQRLEDMLRIAIPGTTLKKDPHINSKITTWKKNYASLTTILSRSGVGFNSKGDNMVDCDPETKKEFMLADDNAKAVLSKPQTLYEDWKILFGKDRATGENVQDVMEAVNELFNGERAAENQPPVGEKTDLGKETHEASFCESSDRLHKDSKRQKKNKIDSHMQTMCELLGQIHRDTNERLERLSTRIGYKADLGKARKEVFEIVKDCIPGLSLDDQLVVGETLAENEKRLEFFMGLPLAARATYVQKMIPPKD